MEYVIINDMNDEIAKKICLWKYEGDYEIYNLPNFETLKEKGYALCNPAKSKEFYCFFNSENKLVAYVRFIKKEDVYVMGIGLSPNHVGHGIGQQIIKLSIDKLKQTTPNTKITLEVRSWNVRAIKCYLKSGFKIVKSEVIKDRLGNPCEFVFMEL